MKIGNKYFLKFYINTYGFSVTKKLFPIAQNTIKRHKQHYVLEKYAELQKLATKSTIKREKIREPFKQTAYRLTALGSN
jgi:hypothetical protein